MIGKIIDYGVEIGEVMENVVDHVRESSGSETMFAQKGQGITEHTHGKSLYFAKNAHLTLNGKVYKMQGPFFALIPKGVSHGWQHANGEGQAVVASFESGHKEYETYAM